MGTHEQTAPRGLERTRDGSREQIKKKCTPQNQQGTQVNKSEDAKTQNSGDTKNRFGNTHSLRRQATSASTSLPQGCEDETSIENAVANGMCEAIETKIIIHIKRHVVRQSNPHTMQSLA